MNVSENSPIDPRNWLLQQAAQAGVYDLMHFEDIDPSLDIAIHRFATGRADQTDEQLIVDSIHAEPPLIGYLRQQLLFEELSEAMGEMPDEYGQKLRDQFMAELPTVMEEFDFSILFEADEDEGERIWYEETPAELAGELMTLRSGDDEPRRELSHFEQLGHCRVKVTIEIQSMSQTESSPKFSMILDFEFVDPSRDRELEVVAVRLEEGAAVESLVAEASGDPKRAVFDSLSAGNYSLDIRSDGVVFDSFMMRIQKGEE